MTRARDLAAGTFELATGGVLKLETSDTTVTDGSVLGKIEFKAPDEASGTDANLTAAAIEAVAEGTFAADNNATELVFKTGASAAADAKMVLTSGGNLLVGQTSGGGFGSTTGVQMISDGRILSTVSGDQALALSRTSTNGNIAEFYKAGTTVGSIGVNTTGAELFIEGVSGKAGLRLGSTKITASLGGTTSGQDGVVDLGQSSTRFKDLYLSGGVYLGGTGSANKLDDYEEGECTIVIKDSSGNSATMVNRVCRYTKAGSLVYISGTLSWSSTSAMDTSRIQFHGVPFTSASSPANGTYRSPAVLGSASSGAFTIPREDIAAGIDPAASFVWGTLITGNNVDGSLNKTHLGTSGFLYGFAITYHTDA